VHIVDLVLPDERGIPQFLARNDRGNFGRPLAAWRALFARHFETIVFEPFSVDMLGVSLWSLVYFTGAARRGDERRAAGNYNSHKSGQLP
jgi:hypothetical protein